MTDSATRVRIVAPLGNPYRRTRLVKMLDGYQRAGLKVEFWGWRRDRTAEESATPPEIPIRHLLRRGRYSSRLRGVLYPLWSLRVFTSTLWSSPEAVVHAVGLESALPVALARIVRRKLLLIYDDPDRTSMVVSSPRVVSRALRLLEHWTQKRSDLHIVPELRRYPEGMRSSRSVIIENVPATADVEKSMLEAPILDRFPGITVYVNGWLTQRRGLSHLAEIGDSLVDNPHVRFLAAGRVGDSWGKLFVGLPNVVYVGEVSQVRALAMYREADIALTLYDPAFTINRYAAANKWLDCVITATPFVVNEEVVTASQYLEDGSALPVRYATIKDDLVDLIANLVEDRERLQKAAARLRLRRDEQVEFESQFQPVVECVSAYVAALAGQE